MENIGNIIEKFRSMKGQCRKDLSKDICTEKYLYMIEKGKRTPSAQIIRSLGDKLGVDLFEYYEYLDCEEPIEAKSAVDGFNKLRRESDWDSLEIINKEAALLDDFKKVPWSYEIELNRLTISVLKNGECSESIVQIHKCIEQIKKNSFKNVCVVNFYVLLSICYQMRMEIGKAKEIIVLAITAFEGKETIEKYSQIRMTLSLNKIALHYSAGEFEKVVCEGLKLCDYEEKKCCNTRSHHTFFYLAFAYYRLGKEDEGIMWYVKALYSILIKEKNADMNYISNYEMFDLMLHDKRISRDLVAEVKKKYKFN
jgi:tetratricopeptide (TPR) repeat protein